MPTSDYDAALRSTYKQENGRKSQATNDDDVQDQTDDDAPEDDEQDEQEV